VPLNTAENKLLGRLVKAGHLTDGQARDVAAEAEAQGTAVHKIALARKYVDESTVTRALARVHHFEFLDLDSFAPDAATIKLLHPSVAHRYRAIPVGQVEGALVAAVDDMTDVIRLDELKAVTGRPLRLVVSTASGIDRALRKYYSRSATGSDADARGESMHGAETVHERDEGTLHSSETRSDAESTDADELRERLRRQFDQARTQVVTGGDAASFDETPITGATTPKPVAVADNAQAAADVLLREILEAAIQARADELEFPVPSGPRGQSRIRREGAWAPFRPYPASAHEAISLLLRQLAGIPADRPEPSDKRVEFPRKAGPIAAVLSLIPAVGGTRAVLRFPANVPIVQQPLRIFNLPRADADRLAARVGGGAGVFLLSSSQSRIAAQVYMSILFEQAAANRSVVSLQWSADRDIPGVTQHVCADASGMRRALATAIVEEPDIVGVASIPDAPLLREAFALAATGRSLVATLSAPDSATARAMISAAGVDAMQLLQGLAAVAHIERLNRLCPDCQELIERSLSRLPEWAEDIDPTLLFEAKGCGSCGNTGRKGTVWVPEVAVADPAQPGSLKALRTREQSLRSLIEGGLIDVRDAL